MLTSYLRNCEVRFGGVKPSLFFGEATGDFALTFTGDTVVSAIAGTDKMFEFQADINTVSFASEGEWGKSGFEIQTLTASFSKASTALDASIKNIKKSLPCGVFAIYVDNNKKGWLVGLAPATEDFYNDYFRTMTSTYNTGTSVEDVDEGNVHTIALGRTSATTKYALADSLTASILDGSATFITYAE